MVYDQIMTDANQTSDLSQSSLANAEEDAQDILKKIPKDLHHLSLETLLPMISVLMAHVQEIKDLKGEDKKALVLYCLDLMMEQMPFPENKVLIPVVDAIAPAAIEGIIKGSKNASEHIEELLNAKRDLRLPAVQLLKIKWPDLRRNKKISNVKNIPKAMALTQMACTKISRPLQITRGSSAMNGRTSFVRI